MLPGTLREPVVTVLWPRAHITSALAKAGTFETTGTA